MLFGAPVCPQGPFGFTMQANCSKKQFVTFPGCALIIRGTIGHLNYLWHSGLPHCPPYLLGLLAMIKCSICSYQCDNWYVSNRKLACHINFSWGCWFVSLLASTSRVALAWHFAKRGAPFGVPSIFFSYGASCVPGC